MASRDDGSYPPKAPKEVPLKGITTPSKDAAGYSTFPTSKATAREPHLCCPILCTSYPIKLLGTRPFPPPGPLPCAALCGDHPHPSPAQDDMLKFEEENVQVVTEYGFCDGHVPTKVKIGADALYMNGERAQIQVFRAAYCQGW